MALPSINNCKTIRKWEFSHRDICKQRRSSDSWNHQLIFTWKISHTSINWMKTWKTVLIATRLCPLISPPSSIISLNYSGTEEKEQTHCIVLECVFLENFSFVLLLSLSLSPFLYIRRKSFRVHWHKFSLHSSTSHTTAALVSTTWSCRALNCNVTRNENILSTLFSRSWRFRSSLSTSQTFRQAVSFSFSHHHRRRPQNAFHTHFICSRRLEFQEQGLADYLQNRASRACAMEIDVFRQ